MYNFIPATVMEVLIV